MSESQPPADADKSNDGGDASASVPKPMEDRTLDEFDPSLHFQPGSSKTSDFMKVTQHGMTETVSANKWTDKIGSRSQDNLYTFCGIKQNRLNSVGNVKQCGGSTKLGFLSHFIERGLYSKHCYLGMHVNHRDLKISHWWSVPPDKQKTMIESITDPGEDAYIFDVGGSWISCYLHGVVDTSKESDDDTIPMRSQTTLAYEDRTHYCFAVNRAMRFMTGSDFQRLLEFFGYYWVDESGNRKADDAQVELDDLVTFFDMFNGFEFHSVEGFKKFYDHFRFSEVFRWKEDLPIWVIHERFGILLRSYVPVRLNLYDGQHRMLLMALFLTGYLTPSNRMPLQQVDWSQSQFADLDYSKMQTFEKLFYAVGMPTTEARGLGPPEANFKMACKYLHHAGNLITEGASNQMMACWDEFFTKLNQTTQSKYTRLVFGNYWGRMSSCAAFDENAKVLFGGIRDLLAAQGRFLSLFLSATQNKATFLQELEPALDSYSNLGGNTRIIVEAREILQLFRCVMHSAHGRQTFLSFFQSVTSTHPQRSSRIDGYLARFQSAEWLRKYVYSVAEKVVDHCLQRYTLERHLVTLLRTSHPDPKLKNGLPKLEWKADDIDKWPSSRCRVKDFSVAGIRKRFSMNTKGGFVHDRVLFGLWCGVVQDIFESIAKYGMDPDFFYLEVAARNDSQTSKDFRDMFTARYDTAREEIITKYEKEGFILDTTNGKTESSSTLMYKYVECDEDDSDGEEDDDDEEEEEDENESDEDLQQPKKKKRKKDTTPARKRKKKYYNIYFDIQEAVIKSATTEQEKMQLEGQYKNCLLREYLRSDRAEFFSDYYYGRNTAKSDKGTKKFSIEVFLQLYVDYVLDFHPLFYCGLSILKGLEGDHSKLLKGPNAAARVKSGITFSQDNNGVFPNTEATARLPLASSILPSSYRFSTFLNGVLSNIIDVDGYTGFVTHCSSNSTHLRKMREIQKHDVLAGYCGFYGNIGSESKEEKDNQMRANYDIEQWKNMLLSEKTTTEDAATIFQVLRAHGLLTKVSFSQQAVKAAYMQYLSTGGANLDGTDLPHFNTIAKLPDPTFDQFKAAQKLAKATAQETPSKTKRSKRKKKDTEVSPVYIPKAGSADDEDAPGSGPASRQVPMETEDELGPTVLNRPTIASIENEEIASLSRALALKANQDKEDNIKRTKERREIFEQQASHKKMMKQAKKSQKEAKAAERKATRKAAAELKKQEREATKKAEAEQKRKDKEAARQKKEAAKKEKAKQNTVRKTRSQKDNEEEKKNDKAEDESTASENELGN